MPPVRGSWMLSWGGRPGQGVDFASHTAKAFLDFLFVRKRAGLLFFVDVHSAFYTAVRPLLYQCDGDDDALALLILSLGIHADFIDPFLQTLRAANAMSGAGASKHLEQLIGTLFANSWWVLKGRHTPTMPQRGFMPGTAVADLAFSLVYRLFLGAMHARLVHTGFVCTLTPPDNPLFPALGSVDSLQESNVSWVDDSVMLLTVGRAADVIPAAKVAGGIIFQELFRTGFAPNVKQGKMQILPVFLSPGHSQAVHDCYFGGDAVVDVKVTDKINLAVAVNFSYKHLGSLKDAKRSASNEIGVRKGEASSALKQLAIALKHTQLPPDRVWLFMQSLCVSKLVYDVHTFSRLTVAQWRSLESCYN